MKIATRELLRCLQIARGETRYFSILARDLGYLSAADFNRLSDGCDTVGKLTNALMTSLKQRLG